jgi:hypothetical protein
MYPGECGCATMSEVFSFRELSVDDAPKIATAISQLVRIGLKPLFPESEFPELARQKMAELEGIGIPDPPLPLTWVALALAGSEQVFANAVHYQDHCFDVAGKEDYAEIVASIMALAGEDWPSANISATSVVRNGRYGPSQRLEIAIDGQGGCAPFDLIVDKDFDWSVVTRLNERLPSGATGRFAALFDGNATIVYLRPDQLKELSKLFGYDFVSEIEPLPERPPSPSHREVAVQNPLPVWMLAFCLLMGVFTAAQPIGMVLRGAPYAIAGHDLTPISFANAPLEFTFEVAIYIVSAGLFLGAPLYLIIMRWRWLRRARMEAS